MPKESWNWVCGATQQPAVQVQARSCQCLSCHPISHARTLLLTIPGIWNIEPWTMLIDRWIESFGRLPALYTFIAAWQCIEAMSACRGVGKMTKRLSASTCVCTSAVVGRCGSQIKTR
eukprot:6194570-Pleurochrysis_carterae.AAC.1